MPRLHFKKIGIIITVLLLPLISVAQVSNTTCAKKGYTIVTINGIFTKEEGVDGAKANRQALEDRLATIYLGEELIVDYLYNPTHGLFGVIDLTDVAIQKTFESVDMQDPDFLKILNAASTQVKTQKVLLVAHSQGNFYANNFYKAVTDSGDVSTKSIGVYGVATPASYVAGNGIYRTSATDTVINRARYVLPGTFLPSNDSISYKESDDSGHGHGFREIYLEYRGEEIKKEVEQSLGKLSSDPSRSENTPCLNPPQKLSTFEKTVSPVVYVVDSVVASTVVIGTMAKNTVIPIAVGTYHITVNTAVWTYNTSVAVAVWTYDTTLAIGKFVGNTVVSAGSFMYNAVTSSFSNGLVASNNSATVILATLPTQTLSSVPAKTQVVTTTQTQNTESPVAKSPQPQTVFVFEPKVQTGDSAPKLVFVGVLSVGGGGAPPQVAPQVLGVTTVAENEVLVEDVVDELAESAGAAKAAPALSAPQCAQTLATDGCLLATTTVHFEWSAVSGAAYYALNKNGAYATTTDTVLDLTIKDFSDYTLEVSAVDAGGNPSAASTQIVSVATIPLAINEIAWMGTVASPNDEWFEIKNNTGHTIDLAQWALNAKDGAPHVALNGTIAPRAYIVFERTDNTAITDVEMHQTYTGALGNAGEQLNLSYASTTFDQTPEIIDDGAWVAGYNSTTTRKTMERYSSREIGTDPTNWGTNLGYIKNGTDAKDNPIDGTPSAQNSVSTLINKGQDIIEDFTLTADEESYVIARDIFVSASSTLTVEPGVEIRFFEENWWNPARLDVEGVLVVRGIAENPVRISSFSDSAVGSIELFGDATSTIDYAQIERTDGVNAYDGGALIITNSDFNENNVAVGAYLGARVTVASSTITNTLDNNAIGVYDGAMMTIASTTIDGVPDGSGVAVYDGTLSIASSTIKNVSDSGISLIDATSTIANVVIENAEWVGIDIYGGTATITDTTISGVDGWAGISITSPSEPVVINGGEVTGNTPFGISMDAGSVVLTGVSVNDNGESEVDNIIIW